MYLQIDNAGFINKGAELMLLSVVARLNRENSLNPCFAHGLNCNGTPEQIMKAGLNKIFRFQRFKIDWAEFVKQAKLDRYNLVKTSSVTAILDAGGFQFGDQWSDTYSTESNKRLAEYYKNYKKLGAKIIFLPQAFGPFKDSLAGDRIKRVFEFSDMLYAREKKSYNYLIQILGKDNKIKQAPDFTCLLEPDISFKLFEKIKKGICIIPNAKMVDKTNREVAGRYLKFLLKISEAVLRRDEKLLLLNHESEGDWKLIELIAQKLGNNDNIITLNNLDALTVKSVIGHCKLLISSRYHGAISGLNQRVPTFVTSWSHKYEELLSDYQLSFNILDVLDFEGSINKIIDAIDQPSHYMPANEAILSNKQKAEEMWQEILAFIT